MWAGSLRAHLERRHLGCEGAAGPECGLKARAPGHRRAEAALLPGPSSHCVCLPRSDTQCAVSHCFPSDALLAEPVCRRHMVTGRDISLWSNLLSGWKVNPVNPDGAINIFNEETSA